MKEFVLAIDQGTTSSRAIAFDANLSPIATAQQEFTQIFPQSGWVEHDPEEIWSVTAGVCLQAIEKSHINLASIASIGITNQRETIVVWDKRTGKAIYNAIVWQDRRTADHCSTLKQNGFEPLFRQKTGLLLDPYFSATKVAWILDNVSGAREAAEAGHLLFGTIDCYLIWRLTGGEVHATDATNASRTLIYNIHDGCWDDELLGLLDIPSSMLPVVKNCADDFGVTRPDLLGGYAIPISGVAGDQQAATLGQACFSPGMLKSTYGTGCFALLNTGDQCVESKHRLLSTIAYQFDGKPTYALEGSIFIAGAVVQWLRDGLKIIRDASETETLANSADPDNRLYLVPAFTGLGAPYWNSECRGAIFGINRDTGIEDLARAALRSVSYQTRDLHEAMISDWQSVDQSLGQSILRIDGGMVANDWMAQSLADILQAPVHRPEIIETTALGVAWLAGMSIGLYPAQDEFAGSWALNREFLPNMSPEDANQRYAGWKEAVGRLLVDKQKL
ncbi:glycerol kinase GlpK [Marinobacterium sp. xm-a-152]|uniref:glycerol kinase GlpK n=1 Tax=Marinobacterium sp. xm-a-152 TaxID=2497733 RepID=UPI00156A0B5C|nr:glycerol kinase GlpK [Marinobacterium sp. xm-a-152]NRP15663.1 Glycerol kinase [Marinobacterium sp. xm-a-152]